MKTNASIAGYRQQVKEDATNAEASKGRHVIDCETGPRRDDVEQERDRYNCDGVSYPSKSTQLERLQVGVPFELFIQEVREHAVFLGNRRASEHIDVETVVLRDIADEQGF